MIFDVTHSTRYAYTEAVSISHHVAHLQPRSFDRQRLIAFSLTVDPLPHRDTSETDFFGNAIRLLTLEGPHAELLVEARSRVDVRAPTPIDPARTLPWELVCRAWRERPTPESLVASQYAFASPRAAATDAIEAYARDCFPEGRPILDAALALCHRIHADFAYDPAATTVTTPVDEAFANRHGVCQDFAHIMLAGLRALGLPARYVSGYLLTHPPEGVDKLVGADASHAWVSLWIPGTGWVDLDPTNDLIPGEEHIVVAWGRDYGDVNPINGVVFGGGVHDLAVAVDVRPVTPDTDARQMALPSL